MSCDEAITFRGLTASSVSASKAARGASAKKNTGCELVLRRELFRRGLRYRLHAKFLAGQPDIVFVRRRVAIFCDGDFWHGRQLASRLDKLARGHNSRYWLGKIRRNAARDKLQTAALIANGWTVLRFWETDILRNATGVADQVCRVLTTGASRRSSGGPG